MAKKENKYAGTYNYTKTGQKATNLDLENLENYSSASGSTYESKYATVAKKYKKADFHEEVQNQYYSTDMAANFSPLNCIDDLNDAVNKLDKNNYKGAMDVYDSLLMEKRLDKFLAAHSSEYFLDVLSRYEVYNNYGICLAKQDDQEGALQYFCKALVYEYMFVMQDVLIYTDVDEFDDVYAKRLTSWNNIKMLLPKRLDKENPFQYIVANECCYFYCTYLKKAVNKVSPRLIHHMMMLVAYMQIDLINLQKALGGEYDRELEKVINEEFLTKGKNNRKGPFDRSKKEILDLVDKLIVIIEKTGIRGTELEVADTIYNDLYEDMLLQM